LNPNLQADTENIYYVSSCIIIIHSFFCIILYFYVHDLFCFLCLFDNFIHIDIYVRIYIYYAHLHRDWYNVKGLSHLDPNLQAYKDAILDIYLLHMDSSGLPEHVWLNPTSSTNAIFEIYLYLHTDIYYVHLHRHWYNVEGLLDLSPNRKRSQNKYLYICIFIIYIHNIYICYLLYML